MPLKYRTVVDRKITPVGIAKRKAEALKRLIDKKLYVETGKGVFQERKLTYRFKEAPHGSVARQVASYKPPKGKSLTEKFLG